MKDKKSSLGKGLDSLLGERKVDSKQGTTEVPLSNLEPGQYQPRKKMHKETLGELAESIKKQGLIQPIVVRKQAAGGFEIVVGEPILPDKFRDEADPYEAVNRALRLAVFNLKK